MRTLSLLALLGTVSVVIVGCSSDDTFTTSTHSGSSGSSNSSGSSSMAFAIPAMCESDDGGTSVTGGGTIDGPGVVGTMCTSAELELDMFGATPQILFNISTGTSAFVTPKGASNADLYGSLGIPEAKPGTYRSSDSGACGTLSFLYALANPPGLDCSTASTPTSESDCPAGCGTACSGLGCEPCKPSPPEVGYAAAAGTFDCDGSPQGPTEGSWTLTLRSVTPYVPPPMANPPTGQPETYVVHGTLSVSVSGSANGGGDAGPGTVDLALEF